MMKFLFKILLCILMSLQMTESSASVYYVAVDGKDDQSGTWEYPLASIQIAQEYASPGDTVYIRGGEYILTEENISRVHQNPVACIPFWIKAVHLAISSSTGPTSAKIRYLIIRR